MTQPSFSVSALVRETPDVLDRFARHYLDLGARQVRLFYDGERHEARVPDYPGIEVVVCDRDFWTARLGRRPISLIEAQSVVYRDSHDSATSDWQFFCDADEFLVTNKPVREILAKVPDDCESFLVANTEAVWGPGDDIGKPFSCTHFRMQLSPRKRKLLRLLLPMRRWDMFNNRGFSGYAFGKHFLRRGTVVDAARYRCHRSFRDGAPIGGWVYDLGFGFETIFLAHFDAISEARWIEKWRRRLTREDEDQHLDASRKAQIAAVREAEAKGDTGTLFRRIYGLTPYEAAVLRTTRALLRRRIFPDSPRI